MLGQVGIGQLVIVLVIVLVLFGAGRLPEIGDALGKGIRNFKRATRGEDDVDVTPDSADKPLSDGERPDSKKKSETRSGTRA